MFSRKTSEFFGLNKTAGGMCAPADLTRKHKSSIEPARGRRAKSVFKLILHQHEPPSFEIGRVYHVFLALRTGQRQAISAMTRGLLRQVSDLTRKDKHVSGIISPPDWCNQNVKKAMGMETCNL